MKNSIYNRTKSFIEAVPKGVKVLAAAKKRDAAEVLEAIRAGIKIIGENYVQEAQAKRPLVNADVSWHMIGSLQKNKVKKAIQIFDVVETVDSIDLADCIEKECAKLNKNICVMVEVNIAREPQKAGIFPERLKKVVEFIIKCRHLRLIGLMAMGSLTDNKDILHKHFKEVRNLFYDIKETFSLNSSFEYLSMGMSSSYDIAIQEGANLVRIGTAIFGPRE